MEQPFSRLRGRKESNGTPTTPSEGGKRERGGGEKFEDYARRNKLDTGLTDDLANDIISHDPGVSWKDIAGSATYINVIVVVV